ncbi:hypothetical protein Dimus_014670 [Dionaea muscipula]
METPPAPPIAGAATTTVPIVTLTTAIPSHLAYPDSLESSPRSRTADSIDDPHTSFPVLPPPAAAKLRLMCSYGGHIVPRPHDKSLCYVGGDTRIVVFDRHSTLADLLSRLSKLLLNGKPFTLKYQLPSEDLDSLITLSTDEDLENMLDEYDRLHSAANSASKPSRLRLFLFPIKPEAAPSSIGSVLEGSAKSDDWFLDALNGTTEIALQRGFSDPTSVNCLLGLEENVENSVPNSKEGDGKSGKLRNNSNNDSNQDVHSVPDSPIIETTSSFGSTSSSLANLPPVRVHVEDGGGGGGGGVRVLDQRIVGMDEQFSQLGVGVGLPQEQDDGFVVMPSQVNMVNTTAVAGVPAAAAAAFSEYLNRVVPDDEMSDHGVSVGYRKPSVPQNQPAMISSQSQQKLIGADFPPSDSILSDSSLSSAISPQKTTVYQDSGGQVPAIGSRVAPNLVDAKVANNVSEPSILVQMQHNSDSGYGFSSQYDPQQQQQQQQLLQQQQPQQQQFFHGAPQYVQHTPAGPVPISSYYPFYGSQLHHHQGQYPLYYIPGAQPQAYSMLVQQANFTDAASANAVPSIQAQTPSNATIISRNIATQRPEMAAGAAASTLVQVPSGQHLPQQQQQQFVGYSQIHHPSQSITPAAASGAAGSYPYEFADPAHMRLYYPQPFPPQLAAQYQTISSAPAMVSPDYSPPQLPTDNVKQQARSSQPV